MKTRSILLLGVLGINAWSTPCLAAKWVDVGSAGVSTDKIMVDTDSVQKVDSFRVVDIMTVYSAARANSHNITLDRHVQRTAFNCADRSFVGIRTLGYLDGKQVGSSQETDDWRVKLHPMPQNPLSDRIYAIVCAASVPVGEAAAPAEKPKAKVYTGSGIVVDRHGSILTNGHVVNKCKSIIVKTSDSKPLAALVSAVDPKNDLALLQTAHESPIGTPARFRSQSKAVKMGESIGVIGYPLSGLLSSEPKATFGQINSVAGINNDYTLLQISAPVQPGNSGGPVLDSSGLVVGVVVSQASMAVTALVGNVPQNVNFAIRGEVAQIFLAARGIKVATGEDWRALTTEAIAEQGNKSTVFILCATE